MNWTELRISLLGDRSESLLPPNMKLPMLPRALMEFSQAAEADDTSPKKLGAIIESDVGLTCELMRFVNSSSNGIRQRIASAQHAISLLGIQKTKLYLCSSAVKTAMKSADSQLINAQVFWNTNLERAIFAREIAKLLDADTDLAFAGGLMQDFVLPILTKELLDTYLAFVTEQGETPGNLHEYESPRHGWTHADAAAQLMVSWGFPDDLICCVAAHHRGLRLLMDKHFGKTAVAAVALSALIPDSLPQVPLGIAELQKLEQVWPAFDLLTIAETVNTEFQEMSGSAGKSHITFLRRCQRALQTA